MNDPLHEPDAKGSRDLLVLPRLLEKIKNKRYSYVEHTLFVLTFADTTSTARVWVPASVLTVTMYAYFMKLYPEKVRASTVKTTRVTVALFFFPVYVAFKVYDLFWGSLFQLSSPSKFFFLGARNVFWFRSHFDLGPASQRCSRSIEQESTVYSKHGPTSGSKPVAFRTLDLRATTTRALRLQITSVSGNLPTLSSTRILGIRFTS